MPKQKNLPKKIPTNLKEYDNFLDIVNNLNESNQINMKHSLIMYSL